MALPVLEHGYSWLVTLVYNLTSSQALYCVQLVRPGIYSCLVLAYYAYPQGDRVLGLFVFGNFTKWNSFLRHLKLFLFTSYNSQPIPQIVSEIPQDII